MKNRFLVITLILILSFNTACYGPFNLTKKLYDWNGKVGDKFTNELVFFAFLVIPVYEVTLFIDGVVLNSIEFWTGSNPIAMNDGDIDVRVVKKDDNTYQITATKNKYHVVQLEGTDPSVPGKNSQERRANRPRGLFPWLRAPGSHR